MKPKVIFHDVTKKYTLQQKKMDKLLEVLSIKKSKRIFYALRNVSFTVNEGETIGVIGINGSGKSTLSNLLAEVMPPTSGEITVNGQTSLIAISVGLNNNLTGLENIELKCLMHGLKKDEIERIRPDIIDFADLGEFIDQPVKNYSSGMKSRLGFAISVHTNPDVMIIDEALSVGDQTFYDKCINKMNDFKAKGKTIFFISHSASQVRSFCDKTIWLHYGELVEFGDSKTVIANYKKFIKWYSTLDEKEKRNYKAENLRTQKVEESNQQVTNSTRSSVKQRKGKQKKSNHFRLAILLVLFFVSTLLMFFDNSVSNRNEEVQNKSKATVNVKSNTPKVEVIKVDKEGVITSENVIIYSDQKFSKELFHIDFMESVLIQKKIDNVLLVKQGETQGYVQQNQIEIIEEPLQESEINLKDLLSTFPPSVQKAYMYYLVFLNQKSTIIENKLVGKTDDFTDELGYRYITFDNVVSYRFNKDDFSDQIKILNIDFTQIDLDQLIEKASVKNIDNQVIYIVTNDYYLQLNLNELTCTIRERKE